MSNKKYGALFLIEDAILANADFRTLCHSLGLTAQTVAALARVQERTVRHWWATGLPPADVWQAVRDIDRRFERSAAEAVQGHAG